MISNSTFFSTLLTIACYVAALAINKKFKNPILNPLLIALIAVVAVLLIFKIDYDEYSSGTTIISSLLTPATICLAVPLYEKLNELKKNWKAILIGIFSGVITSGFCVFIVCFLFNLDKEIYASFIPKSVTTAIGINISEELGGIVALTTISIVITGILGNFVAETILKACRITHPVAKGVAIGCSSHAGGTAKAVEMGETEGAISGLSIAVAGLMTVVTSPLFALLMR